MLHTKFQASEPLGSQGEDFLIFLCYFYGSKLWRLVQGHFGSWDLCLIKFDKGLPDNATYQIQASEPSSFEEEDL